MENWRIAKELLKGDEYFAYLYNAYEVAVKMARTCSKYSRMNLETKPKPELHNMLRKVNRCWHNIHAFEQYTHERAYNDNILSATHRFIQQELNRRTALKEKQGSKKDMRRARAKARHGQGKSKNR